MSNLPESQMTARNGRLVTADLTAEVAKVLAAHEEPMLRTTGLCCCGWNGEGYEGINVRWAYRAHVAAEVTNAVVTALAGIETHNREPITPESLRWAATHEALSRSWIFDVLTGLADTIDALTIPEALGAGEVDRG